jgi:hypothetical protein
MHILFIGFCYIFAITQFFHGWIPADFIQWCNSICVESISAMVAFFTEYGFGEYWSLFFAAILGLPIVTLCHGLPFWLLGLLDFLSGRFLEGKQKNLFMNNVEFTFWAIYPLWGIFSMPSFVFMSFVYLGLIVRTITAVQPWMLILLILLFPLLIAILDDYVMQRRDVQKNNPA